jgi:hypothetical protein
VGKASKSRGNVAENEKKHGPVGHLVGFTSAFLFTTTRLFTPEGCDIRFDKDGSGVVVESDGDVEGSRL